ncbi:hypothetical protein ABPG77_002331 [Micractinium sp. CCAP 211/92]
MTDRRLAPTAILQQAISQFEQEGSRALPEFVAAPKFQGARPGYYFGRGASGVGYYLDSKQAGSQLDAAAAGDDADAAAAAAAEAMARRAARPLDAEELLREAEEAAGDAGMEMLDLKGLKRLTLALERKYNANLEARMRHADAPAKFLDSEADLDEAVKALLVVATAPDLYPELVASTNAVPTLLALLNHENSDIAADAIEVMAELTDGDAVEDNEEEARVLVDALLEHDALPLLVHRLSAFDEKVPAEAAAVYNILAILENMAEVKPEVAELALEKTKLLKWLLARLRPREVDSNKQYASEILAILVQQSDANKRKMGSTNGIDAVLQAIAPYRNRDPETTEEEEFVENLFDVVASCLLLEENKAVFVEAEGVELLLLILKGKRAARTSALKCLDFATTRCAPACDRVVDQQGLKTLFAIFMGKLKVKRKDESAAAEEEERTVSIIASLLLNCSKQSRRDRVAAKFVEAEFEKCDRLMEVYLRYEGRVAAEEARLAEEAEDDMDEEELLLARMDAGLFTLQQCALVVGALWLVGDVGVRKRILRLLHQKSRTLGSLRSVLLEYRANLGDEDGAEERARQVEQATQMLVSLGHNPADDEAEKAAAEAKKAAAEAAHAAAAEAAAANGGSAAAADAGGDMEVEEAEASERGARPAAPAEPDTPAEQDTELEEGEQRLAAPDRQQPRGRDNREGAGDGHGGRERERRRSRSRSREPGEKRPRSRSQDRERRREKERRRSRSRSPGRDKERRREKERRRSRSRSRERSRRDRR